MSMTETFARETKGHQMTIKLDQGLYRHLEFRDPKLGYCQSFQIITWPGYLAYCGDMGSFTFARIEDMFQFFRHLKINPNYWAEKLEAADEPDGYEKYDPEKMRRAIKEDHRQLDKPARAAVSAEVKEILYCVDDEYDTRRRIGDVEFEGRQVFADFWEHDCKSFTGRFLWCCHAIRWAVEMYDKRPAP